MDRSIHQPNDSLFKKAMSDIRIAKDFFQSHLPKSILESIDLQRLQLENRSFIDEHYSKSESDIVYSVKDSEKSATYFYLLCEQQSTVHKMMPFRLLKYQIRLMDQHLEQNPKDNLPIVYPIVLYSGEQPWDHSYSLFTYFGKQEALARELWGTPFQLIDLHRMDDEEIQKRRVSGLMEFALKNKVIRNSRQFLKTFLPWLETIEVEMGDEFGKIMLQFALHEADGADKEIFIEELNQHQASNKIGGEAMTLAEQFREEGWEKGLQKGLQTGLEKGQKKIMAIAKTMLLKGMTVELVAELTGLEVSIVEELMDSSTNG